MVTIGGASGPRSQRDLVPAAQLTAMVQSSQAAIIGKDLDGVIISWDPGAGRLHAAGMA